MFNKRFISDRVDCDSLLQQTVEDLAPTSGVPSVEPKYKFIQIVIETSVGDPTLMDSKQPAFEQGRYPMDTGKVYQRILPPLAIQDHGIMGVAQSFQTSIALSPIGDDHAASRGVRSHESTENPSAGIREFLKSYSSDLLPSDFRCDADENFVPYSADHSLINLDPAVELFPARPDHSPAQLVEHDPSSFIAPQAQRSLESQRADPTLLIGNPPGRAKPEAQADLAPIKNRARRDSDVPAAASTPQHTSRGSPNLPMIAPWALDSLRPAQTGQVVTAGLFRSEAMFEFEQSRGIAWRDLKILEFGGALGIPQSRDSFVDNSPWIARS